jgi:hypothetical protein
MDEIAVTITNSAETHEATAAMNEILPTTNSAIRAHALRHHFPLDRKWH